MAPAHAAIRGGSSAPPAADEPAAPDEQPGEVRRYAAWLFLVPVLFSLIMHVASLLSLAIAKANGGDFTRVEVLPGAKEAAKRNPIKKNGAPGPVWGLKIRGK